MLPVIVQGVMRLHTDQFDGSWTPVFHAAQHRKSSEEFWPVGLSMHQLCCVVCKEVPQVSSWAYADEEGVGPAIHPWLTSCRKSQKKTPWSHLQGAEKGLPTCRILLTAESPGCLLPGRAEGSCPTPPAGASQASAEPAGASSSCSHP